MDAFGIRNGAGESSYNGAIMVSGDAKDHRFSIACNTKRLNCFPVLMDIISNGLLGMFNSLEQIQTDRAHFLNKKYIPSFGSQASTLLLTGSDRPWWMFPCTS